MKFPFILPAIALFHDLAPNANPRTIPADIEKEIRCVIDVDLQSFIRLPGSSGLSGDSLMRYVRYEDAHKTFD